jgi:DNA topoisomerase-1
MGENLEKRAERQGLRYVTTEQLRLTRRKGRIGFLYFDAKGELIRNRKIIDRINELAIPPAWTDVRISADPNAHLQAIGRDDAGRLQYRYHKTWTEVRDRLKSERLLRFGRALPKIRARVDRDLKRRKTDRRYAAAVAGRLIDKALLRAGHSTEAIEDGGRGATTLLKRDVKLNGTKVELRFTGKSGKEIKRTLRDPILLSRLRKLKRIGKKRLFAFEDEAGRCCYLSARDLNAYLRDAAGAPVTAKDFRTFAASAHALAVLCAAERPETARGRKALLAEVMRQASEQLNNTPAIARSSYVHPLVVRAFDAGELDASMLRGLTRDGLDKAETALMRFVEGPVASVAPVTSVQLARKPPSTGSRRRRTGSGSRRPLRRGSRHRRRGRSTPN